MAEILGHGKVIVELENNLDRDLAKAKAQFDKVMADIDGQEAKLHLKAEDAQFVKKYKDVQRKIKDFENEIANAKLGADTKPLERKLAAARGQLTKYGKENEVLTKKLESLDARRAKAQLDQEGRIAKAHADRAKAYAAAAKKEEDAAKKLSAEIEKAEKQKAEATAKAERARRKEIEATRKANLKASDDNRKAAEKAAAAAKRAGEAERKANERLAAARDKQRTEATLREIRAIEAAHHAAILEDRKRASRAELDVERAHHAAIVEEARRTARAELEVERDHHRAIIEDRKRFAKEAERLAADDENVGALSRQYAAQQRRVNSLHKSRGRLLTTTNERHMIDLDISTAEKKAAALRARLQAIGEPPPEVDLDTDKGAAAISKWAHALSDASVRVGPFTTSLGNAARGLTLLGPVIAGVAGAILSLGSALGMGLAGGIGVAGAALTGFIPLIGGTAMAMVPLITEISRANKAQDAYDKAVRENGKTSDQAKNKLKILNRVTKGMSETTKDAVAGWSGLKTQFKEATDTAARRNFGKVFGEGIKTASALVGPFGRQVSRFMDTSGTGISKWMKGMRSVEGQNILGNIFRRANESAKPFLNGIGNLGAVLGRTFSAFADHLPSLSRGFETWTENLSRLSKGDGLKNTVQTMVDGLRATGQLLRSTGSLLFNFMRVGADGGGGIDFMNDIADGLDRINRGMMAGGGKGLAGFFGDSIETTKSLYGVLQPLASIFMEWVTIMQPITNQFLKFAGAVSSVFQAIAGSGVGRGAIYGFFSLFLAGNVAGKILQAGNAINSLARSMKALGAVAAVSRVGDMLTGGLVTQTRNLRQTPTMMPGMRRGGLPGDPDYDKQATSAARAATATAAVGAAAGSAAPKITEVDKATRAARVGAAGLGIAAGAASGVLTAGLSVAAIAAGYGIYKMVTRVDEADKANKRAAESFRAYGEIVRGMPQLHTQTAASALSVSQAELDVAAAAKVVKDLRKQGKTGTDDYKQAVLNLQAAEQSEYITRQQVTEASKAEKTAKDAMYKQAQKNVKNTRTRVDELRNDMVRMGEGSRFGITLEDAFSAVQRGAKKAGVSVKDFIKDQERMPDSTKEKLLDYADAVGKSDRANRLAEAAQRRMTLASINHSRALQGMIPLTGRAATALINLRKIAGSAGKGLSVKIATKFADAGDAKRVANSASKSLRQGVPTRIVTKIVADSKNADQAISKLQKARIVAKTVRIIEQGGQAAIKRLEQIAGRKLSPHEMRIVERGGPQAIALLRRLSGTKISDKRFAAILRDLASGKIGSVRALLAGLRDKTVTVRSNYIETHYQKTVKQGGGGSGARLRWSGGGRSAPNSPPGALQKTSMIRQAYDSATSRASENVRGGVYRRPTLLVGEERRSEYVIATNPAYRKRNTGFLAQAASNFGLGLVDPQGMPIRAAYSGMGDFKNNGYYAKGSVGNLSKDGNIFSPKLKKKNKVTWSRRGNPLKPYRGKAYSNPWASHMHDLMEQQQDVEREISIAEGAVPESEDFISEATDPATGKTTYSLNQPAIDAYVKGLSEVKKWEDTLTKVTAEIVQSVPKAETSTQNEVKMRNRNISALRAAITREEKRAKTKAKDSKSKKSREKAEKIRASAQARLKKLRPELSKETKARDGAQSLYETLSGEVRKEAGFDYREAVGALNVTNKELADVQGRTAGEVNERNVDSSGGAGGGADGGGGDTGPSLQQQTGMADTERGQIAQQYSSNALNPGGGGLGGMGGGGMQSNPGGLAALAGAAGAATLAVAGMTSSIQGGGGTGGVLSALSSGVSAGTALSSGGTGGTSGGYVGGGGDSGKTVNITNNFQTQPSDPHTWSAGVAFEANALL